MQKEKLSSGRRPDMRRRWLFSYLVIFCLPLIAYLFMSFMTLSIIRRQTYDLNKQALNITSVAIDKQVESIETIATEIMANQTLKELIAVDFKTGEREYRLFQLKGDLEAIVSQNSLIESAYIYMYGGDYIISNRTKARLSYFFENECTGLVMNGQEWRNILRTPHLKEYMIWESTSSQPTLMLLVSVPLFEGAPRATICLKLNAAKFWQVVEQNKDMAMAVYDSQGTLVYTHAQSIDTAPVMIESKETNWRYEGYIEAAVMEEQAGYVNILFFCGLILVSVTGVLLIVLNVQKNYNPIREMVRRLEEIIDKRQGEMEELPYIEDSLSRLVKELQAKQEEMKEHMTLMNQAYLICFLLGQFPKGISVTEELRVLGFDELTRFCVLLLDAKRPVSVVEASGLLLIGIEETCLYYGRGVELNGRIAFIIDSESGDEESQAKLHDRLAEELPGGQLAWSVVYEGGRNLHYAYEEALYILNLASTKHKGIMTLAQMQQEQDKKVQIPVDLENVLAKGIQNGDMPAVRETVQEILADNVRRGMSSIVSIKVAAVAIYNYVLRLRQANQVSFGQTEMLMFHNIQVKARTQQEVLDALCTGIQRITNQIASGGGYSRDEQLVNRMKSYIDEHYNDVLLSVDSLCRAFERSSSGVNKAFKDVNGQGPLHYINYRRIQEAKRIFVESGGDCSASDVLKKVGYTNLNTFTRAFKRHEGITPGQYKEAIMQAKLHK